MKATWTDTRLDEFATQTDWRFDKVDRTLGKVEMDFRDAKLEIVANNRSARQLGGLIDAAQMATVATLIAIHV